MLSWHAIVTINSSLALGDDGFGPKQLAEHSIALIVGTAVTTWSTALACNVRGRKNLSERQGTYLRALARARAQFPGNFSLRKNQRSSVFVNEEGSLTSFDSDSCCACSSCCRAGPHLLLHMTLGGISEQIVTIFFVSTHEDQWFCAKRYLILGL